MKAFNGNRRIAVAPKLARKLGDFGCLATAATSIVYAEPHSARFKTGRHDDFHDTDHHRPADDGRPGPWQLPHAPPSAIGDGG